MSVTLTEQAVVERRKTVTRRLGWRFLEAVAELELCRKVTGRRAGDPLVRLARVEVVDVRRERLDRITAADIVREGVAPDLFAELDTDTGQPSPATWVAWFCAEMGVHPHTEVTRIEWRYVDPEPAATPNRCSMARTRARMSDSEFWEHALAVAGRPLELDVDVDLPGWEGWSDPDMVGGAAVDSCRTCGAPGTCGYDIDGRPFVHIDAMPV